MSLVSCGEISLVDQQSNIYNPGLSLIDITRQPLSALSRIRITSYNRPLEATS